VLLPGNRVVTGMVSEWAPASLRDPAGAMLLVSVGVLVVAVARSPQARAPQQLLRMALLVGLALWAVRASVWFGLALPVALCTLARGERAPRLAGADRGSPPAGSLVLIALAVTMIAATPQVRRALIAGGASRPELNAAPTATDGWLAENRRPAGCSTTSPGVPTWSSGWGRR
jgi:hypothetical protein